jgi:LIM homeobox protein 2/9
MKSVIIEMEQFFCKNDYLQKYTRQCSRCLTSIKPQELVMNVKETYFHLNCFNCGECGEMLKQGENFMMGINGTLTCYKHLDSQPLESEPNEQVPVKSQPKKARLQTASSKSESLSEDDEDRESTPEQNSKDRMGKRMRTSFKHHQLREMKRYFQLNHNPDAKDLKGLAQKTGLTKRVLQVWFQNARAKYRRSQANNPNCSSSPNGCILPPMKFEQCYPPATSSSISGGSARASTSPFECNGTTSSFSRSISPEFDNQSSSASKV